MAFLFVRGAAGGHQCQAPVDADGADLRYFGALQGWKRRGGSLARLPAVAHHVDFKKAFLPAGGWCCLAVSTWGAPGHTPWTYPLDIPCVLVPANTILHAVASYCSILKSCIWVGFGMNASKDRGGKLDCEERISIPRFLGCFVSFLFDSWLHF